MSKLDNEKGFSRIEVFCITGIALILIIFIFTGIRWYHNSLARGNDSMRVNSAESVAAINLTEGGCVVTSCRGGFDGKCEHADSFGRTTGYYDGVKKKIFAQKPAGYNEYPEMKVGETEYTGDIGTMIIRVTADAGEITLDWIEGAKD